MSNIFVTENGFIKKTFEEIKTEYENNFKLIFGADIDLDSAGSFGQLVGLLSNKDTLFWEGLEEVYNSRNPNAAIGVQLDNICAETGVIRQSATKTTVYDVFLYGDLSTVISTGEKARQAASELDYVLLNDVTISLATTREVVLTINTPGDAETFTITIDSTPYTYITSVPPDTDIDVATELKTDIEAGSFAGDVTQDGATLTITQITEDFLLAFTANITLDKIAAAGDFEAEDAGENPLPATTLDTIVTPVSGWDEVYNPVSGLTGRERETDEELRIRRAQTLFTGNSTEDAIVAAISNNVTGIIQVAIASNRTDTTDTEGLPPHSFEVVVSGGDDNDIAKEIWETQPAGIASYGTTEIIVQDSQGIDQSVFFSRPEALYIWVKVQRDLYDEEIYPTDGDTAIKQAIVDWASENQPIGKDVIRQRLNIPVYEVAGVGDIDITIDDTDTPGGTPVYAEKDIAILAREYADFIVDRIIVEDKP